MKKKIINLFTLLFVFALFTSCSNDSTISEENEEQQEENSTNDDNPVIDDFVPEGEIEIHDQSKTENSITLVMKNGGDKIFLMTKEGENLHEWPLSLNLGNDGFLLDSGELLVMAKDPEPEFTFGGYGGVIQKYGVDKQIIWEKQFSSESLIAHHDVEELPNGNVLFLVWEKIEAEDAFSNGYRDNMIVYPEAIYEYNPNTDEIVWEWHSWNHIIQNFDSDKLNYANPIDNQHKIDINYATVDNGDIMHANGLAYDEALDVIYISANFFSEVWVIDHSTTTEEAANDFGGNFQKGGTILHRFGNPEAYGDFDSTRYFYNNHHPNIFEQDKMLLFMNGSNTEQSVIYEFSLPTESDIINQTNRLPEILWSYSNPDLFSERISGAVRLRNGNTLITEGDYGLWEVTQEGEVVWKFNPPFNVWRSYNYYPEDDAIKALNLTGLD